MWGTEDEDDVVTGDEDGLMGGKMIVNSSRPRHGSSCCSVQLKGGSHKKIQREDFVDCSFWQ